MPACVSARARACLHLCTCLPVSLHPPLSLPGYISYPGGAISNPPSFHKQSAHGKNVAEKLYESIRATPADGDIRRRLRKHLSSLSAALLKELNGRLKTPEQTTETLAQCLCVIRIANHSFSRIYAAVWSSIAAAETDGVEAYQVALATLLVVAGDKAIQRK